MKSPRSLVLLSLCAACALQAAPEFRERTHMRNERYGEILVVKGGLFSLTASVYNTIGLNNCPEAAWRALDPAVIKKLFSARAVILNGPRHFLMDSNAIQNPGPVASFGGLQARLLATLPLSSSMLLRGKSKPYTGNRVSRTTRYVFKKGRPVYELVSPKGVVYVMQSYSLIVDPRLTMAQLSTLGSRLKLPKGWQYRVRVPTENLVLSVNGTAYVLQDEFQNSYQREN
jgi:hypothetical protein